MLKQAPAAVPLSCARYVDALRHSASWCTGRLYGMRQRLPKAAKALQSCPPWGTGAQLLCCGTAAGIAAVSCASCHRRFLSPLLIKSLMDGLQSLNLISLPTAWLEALSRKHRLQTVC